MKRISEIREQIYNHFHSSQSCKDYFLSDEHKDEYAAYYTAMYLLQDSTDALSTHRGQGFARNSLLAYIELWGVMQAIIIQQDSIEELYKVLTGCSFPSCGNNWKKIRNLRVLCTGHPVDKGKRGRKQRTFAGRDFGGYDRLILEVWSERDGKTTFPSIELGKKIDAYTDEAAERMIHAAHRMYIRWP